MQSQCVLAHFPFAKIVEMAVDNHMNKKVTNIVPFATLLCSTVPIAEILSGKNARAWVSMVLYLKK